MKSERIAIVGLGNCASAALQGLTLHRQGKLSAEEVGLAPLYPNDILKGIEFVCAFDIDRRKVGRSVPEAVFAASNCVSDYGANLALWDFPILRGPVLDGISNTMAGHPVDEIFWPDETTSPVDIAAELSRYGVTLVFCMLPTGAVEACETYAHAALRAGAGFVNGSATLLANQPEFQALFAERGLLLIGDDFKSQFGATYLNQVLLDALHHRACRVISTSQANIGGNTDFLNMLDPARSALKEQSKLNALGAWLGAANAIDASAKIGGYRPELGDTKLADLEIEAVGFAGRPFKLSVHLRVEDSPNAAGVISNILAGAIQGDRADVNQLGAAISTMTMKSPWRTVAQEAAFNLLSATGA